MISYTAEFYLALIAFFTFLGVVARVIGNISVARLRKEAQQTRGEQQIQLARVAAEAAKVAEKTDNVAAVLQNNTSRLNGEIDGLKVATEGIRKVTTATHSLVNAKWGEALRVRMIETQQRANLEPAYQPVADAAAADYREHMDKQAGVDAQPGTDEEKSGRA